MPVAETVAILADQVATAKSPLTPWEQALVAALMQMPEFRDNGAIDEWEAMLRDVWNSMPDEVTDAEGYFETPRLLRLVFELGRCNLYTAWSTSAVTGEYNFLVRELKTHHGIPISEDLDLSSW